MKGRASGYENRSSITEATTQASFTSQYPSPLHGKELTIIPAEGPRNPEPRVDSQNYKDDHEAHKYRTGDDEYLTTRGRIVKV